MDITHAIILSIIEGITEFLPVSSTGHMILASQLMGLAPSEFLKTFEIAIQCGAILAVVAVYWRTFLLDWEVLGKLFVAFIPTAIVGLVLYKIVKMFLLSNPWVVIWALFLGGVALIVFELLLKNKDYQYTSLEQIPWNRAVVIGLCQALAMVPGVSRSGATILGGLCLGVSRPVIVEFSFLLAVPTMMAATGLDILKTKAVLSSQEWGLLLIGAAVAFAVAFIVIKLFLSFVRRFSFISFGVYRIIAALVMALILMH